MSLRSIFSILSLFFVLSTQSASAIQLVIAGKDRVVASREIDAFLGQNVLAVTRSTLERAGLPYQMRGEFLVSIGSLYPRTEHIQGRVRAWGWCYEIDGQQPNKSASEIRISKTQEQILWFYGYMEQSPQGVWSTECSKSTALKTHLRTR